MKNRFRVPPDLITVRHKRGVSLHEIAASTKIGVNYLQAIEEGDFQKLPGGVYSTSYIRQYAQAIDYDEEELLGYYRRALDVEVPERLEPVARRQSGRWAWFVRVLS